MTSLKGNLDTVDLSNIFQMLSLNQREGTLYIFEGPSRKAIYFGHDGVSMASKGKNRSDALGRILLRYDRVTPEQLSIAIQKQAEAGRLLGQVLVEEGVCTRADIDEALQIQIREEVYSLFIWKEAQFEFIEGPPDEEFGGGDVQKLTFNVNSLIMEAAKGVDEWSWIKGLVHDETEIYRYTGTNVDLTDSIFHQPYAGKVLAAIDGRRSVADVIETSCVNKFEACKIHAILLEGGAIQRLSVEELRAEADAAVAAGDTATAVKFLSRLVAARGDTPEMHKQLAEAFEGEREIEKAAQHHRVYAQMKTESHEPAEAFAAYRRICELLPTDLAAAESMIEVFAQNSDGLEEHAKDVVEAGKRLAEIYVELKRSSRAVQVLHRILALGPDDPDLRGRLISVYLASGMPGEAIAEYEAQADAAVSAKDYDGAEKIYRKILSIDRRRPDALQKVEHLVSRRRRRERDLRNVVVAAVLIVVAAVGAVYGLAWYKTRKTEQTRRESECVERLKLAREAAGPVRGELDRLLADLTNRPSDLALLAKTLAERKRRIEDVAKLADAVGRDLGDLHETYEGLAADEDAAELLAELNGRLASLRRTVADIDGTLRDAAEGCLAAAQQMLLKLDPTRAVLEKLDAGVRIAADCDGWAASESGRACQSLRAQVQEYLTKFDTTKADVEKKVADGDFDGAYDVAVGYLTDRDFPPPDLREAMPVPIRLVTTPPGARVMTRDGADTGLRTGPGCTVNISLLKGATFVLQAQGFEKVVVTIPAVRDVDAAVVTQRIKRAHVFLLEKSAVFRHVTSDGRPLSAAPFGSRRFLAVPGGRACDVFDLELRKFVSTLPLAGDRAVRASGVVAERTADDATVVLPTSDGSLLFFDAATGAPRGTWTEHRGALTFDLALVGGDVLAQSDRGDLHCVEVGSRQKRWTFRALSASGEAIEFSAAPVVAADGAGGAAAFVGCGDGSVRVVDLASGLESRRFAPPVDASGRVCAPVVVDGGFMYFLNRDVAKQTRATKWSLREDRVAWSVVVAGEVKSAPMPHGDTVFLVTTAGEVVGLKSADGSRTHAGVVERAVKVLGEAVVNGDVLYVGCDDGVFRALDLHGPAITPSWQFQVKPAGGKPAAVTTRCALVGGLVVFGASDGAAYAVEGGR